MSSNANVQPGSRNDFEIDDKTVRKHGRHDGNFDVEYDRLVDLAVDEVGQSKWEQTGVADD